MATTPAATRSCSRTWQDRRARQCAWTAAQAGGAAEDRGEPGVRRHHVRQGLEDVASERKPSRHGTTARRTPAATSSSRSRTPTSSHMGDLMSFQRNPRADRPAGASVVNWIRCSRAPSRISGRHDLHLRPLEGRRARDRVGQGSARAARLLHRDAGLHAQGDRVRTADGGGASRPPPSPGSSATKGRRRRCRPLTRSSRPNRNGRCRSCVHTPISRSINTMDATLAHAVLTAFHRFHRGSKASRARFRVVSFIESGSSF